MRPLVRGLLLLVGVAGILAGGSVERSEVAEGGVKTSRLVVGLDVSPLYERVTRDVPGAAADERFALNVGSLSGVLLATGVACVVVGVWGRRTETQ